MKVTVGKKIPVCSFIKRTIKCLFPDRDIAPLFGYYDWQIQAKIDAGYIPIADPSDLYAISTTYIGDNKRIYAAGTKWETLPINTDGRSGSYIQVNDIDLDNATMIADYPSWYSPVIGWEPICSYPNPEFTGIYDGGEYEIQNLYMRGANTYRGLFGRSDLATIKNVRLIDVDIVNTLNAIMYSGSLIGLAKGTTFTNCGVTGTIVFAGGYVGGMVGYSDKSGSVISQYLQCFFNGSMTGANSYVGGIVGYSGLYALLIKNCYAWGSVSGNDGVGGLIGRVTYATEAYTDRLGIHESYAACIIAGVSNLGGAIGYSAFNDIGGLYYDSDISGTVDLNGDPRTTSQLKQGFTSQTISGDMVYQDWSSYVWDFRTTSDYPILRRFKLEQSYPTFMEPFRKYVNNPIEEGNYNEFYPVGIIEDGGIYYAVGKENLGLVLGMYSSADGRENWSYEGNKIVYADIPYAPVGGKVEGNTIIKKDGIYYIIFGVRVALWHQHVGIASCTTVNGAYTIQATPLLAWDNNDTLARIGIDMTHLNAPDCVRVGDTFYWFNHMVPELTVSFVWYMVLQTSPANDWLNITTQKILFSSADLAFILPPTVITMLQIPRVHYYQGWYYLTFTCGGDQNVNKQRSIYVMRSRIIDQWDLSNLQKLPIVEGGEATEWDSLRDYAHDILREQDGFYLTPKIRDGKVQMYFSGHNLDWDINTGVMALAEGRIPRLAYIPIAPSDLIATTVSYTRIDLSWTNNDFYNTAVSIERSYDGITFTEIDIVLYGISSYQDDGIMSSTTYYYRLKAYKNIDYSDPSNIAHATTDAIISPYEIETENLLIGERCPIPPSTALKDLINDTILGLKNDGVFALGDAMYIRAVHNRTLALQNWIKNEHNGTLKGSTFPAFVADNGFRGDGVSGYIDNNYIPGIDGVNLTLNSASIAFMQKILSTITNRAILGATTTIHGYRYLYVKFNLAANENLYLNSAVPNSNINIAADDYIALTRTGTTLQGYKNGVVSGASVVAAADVDLMPRSIFELAYNGDGKGAYLFNDGQNSFSWFGGFLTPTQTLALYNRVKHFFNTIAGITPPLLDLDGNTYTTTIINNQEWTIQNFRCTKYADGSVIANITDAGLWAADTVGAYVWYDNNIANKPTYGALYNQYAIKNIKGLVYLERDGIQESGWRVPVLDDVLDLLNLYGGNTLAGEQLNSNRTNSSGFTAVFGGRRTPLGTFQDLGTRSDLWTSEDTIPLYAMKTQFLSADIICPSAPTSYNRGACIRFVRDV